MTTMPIHLKDIWPVEQIAKLEDFKVHFAKDNGKAQPLDAWARKKRDWQKWQETYPSKNDFNRPYIFSLMQFYHEYDTWLFGGIFKVLERPKKGCANPSYKVKLTKPGEKFIGRLKIHFSYKTRNPRVKMEDRYKDFEVKGILATPYGRPQ